MERVRVVAPKRSLPQGESESRLCLVNLPQADVRPSQSVEQAAPRDLRPGEPIEFLHGPVEHIGHLTSTAVL